MSRRLRPLRHVQQRHLRGRRERQLPAGLQPAIELVGLGLERLRSVWPGRAAVRGNVLLRQLRSGTSPLLHHSQRMRGRIQCRPVFCDGRLARAPGPWSGGQRLSRPVQARGRPDRAPPRSGQTRGHLDLAAAFQVRYVLRPCSLRRSSGLVVSCSPSLRSALLPVPKGARPAPAAAPRAAMAARAATAAAQAAATATETEMATEMVMGMAAPHPRAHR